MVDVGNLSSEVEVWLSCRGLKDMDLLSKSDPFVVLYIKDPKTKRWLEVGRTETIQNNLDPDFKKRFTLKYMFEENQELKFEAYDADDDSTNLSNHDFLGEARVLLANLVTAPGQTLQSPLYKMSKSKQQRKIANKGRSRIIIHCEEVAASNEFVTMTISGRGLDKKDFGFWASSDPYFIIYRQNLTEQKDTSWLEVYRSQTIKNNLNPNWKQFTIPAQVLCNGDHYRVLKFVVMDWDKVGDDDLIGEFECNLNTLQAQSEFVLYHPKKKAKKGAKYLAKGSGKLVYQIDIRREYSFLDFLKGGMSISLMVAIDFTASNGDPASPQSLHYLHGADNEYLQAIRTVGNILAPYDSDQLIPVWGFGARLTKTNQVSHCFNLTFSHDPEVRGVDGLEKAYKAAFPHLRLSGPTYFSEIIQTATAIASQSHPANQQEYYILLIITDGVINDMAQTVRAVVQAANHPLSIIIVGVGDADFSNMDTLDGDDDRLYDPALGYAKRDIVQFVPFRKVLYQRGIECLSSETLAEVPTQVTQWAKAAGVKPLDADARLQSYQESKAQFGRQPTYLPASMAQRQGTMNQFAFAPPLRTGTFAQVDEVAPQQTFHGAYAPSSAAAASAPPPAYNPAAGPAAAPPVYKSAKGPPSYI